MDRFQVADARVSQALAPVAVPALGVLMRKPGGVVAFLLSVPMSLELDDSDEVGLENGVDLFFRHQRHHCFCALQVSAKKDAGALRLKPQRTKKRPLTEGEAALVLAWIADYQNGLWLPLFTLLYDTGCALRRRATCAKVTSTESACRFGSRRPRQVTRARVRWRALERPHATGASQGPGAPQRLLGLARPPQRDRQVRHRKRRSQACPSRRNWLGQRRPSAPRALRPWLPLSVLPPE